MLLTPWVSDCLIQQSRSVRPARVSPSGFSAFPLLGRGTDGGALVRGSGSTAAYLTKEQLEHTETNRRIALERRRMSKICFICQEALDHSEVVALECALNFHVSCAREWAAASGQAKSCPHRCVRGPPTDSGVITVVG